MTRRTEDTSKKIERYSSRNKSKSMMNKVLYHRYETPIPLFIFEFILAFLADGLKTLLRFVLWLVGIVGGISVVAAIIAGIVVYPKYSEYSKFADEVVSESTKDTFKTEESTYVYAADGSIIAKLRGNQDSIYLSYDNIPENVINAFVAIEDQNYWDNSGVDFKGILRAGLDAMLSSGDNLRGASTITQQLSRSIFLTNEVSLERKFKEMFIAWDLTDKYTKKQIMEFYVNNCFFANNYYGIEAASYGYFSKPSSELTLGQITYLCAIPNGPSYYDPVKHPERALDRRDHILRNMVECGYIEESEYIQATNEEVVLNRQKYKFNSYETTYAVDCAVKQLMKQNDFQFRYSFENMKDYKDYKSTYDKEYKRMKDELYTGGYKIYTSLNPEKQDELQKALDKQLSNVDNSVDESTGAFKLQGAITAIDNTTNKVIAVVGGRSSSETEDDNEVYGLNRAYQSYRQPGSSIKPLIVYGPALMNGYTPESMVENIDVSVAKQPGTDVQALHGEQMTLANALTWSKNGVAWKLFDELSPNYGFSFLSNMRFESICPDDYNDAASLGGLTYGATTVEMASGFNTIVNDGYYNEPTCLVRLLNSDGDNIYEQAKEKSIYTEDAAKTLQSLLVNVVNEGTARGLNWSGSSKTIAAGKTGTTNDNKDGYFCGFTPYYTVAVWVGYDQPKKMSSLQGASYPGQIWKASMLELIKGQEVVSNFDDNEISILDPNEPVKTEGVTGENSSETLPEEAYTEFMPGRADEEELSPGYTVYNYRVDHTLGKQIATLIEQMKAVDKSLADANAQVDLLYQQAKALVEQIFGVTYRAEMDGTLATAYQQAKGQ